MDMGRNRPTSVRGLFAAALLLFLAPAVATGQEARDRVSVKGAAGGLMLDGGNSQSIAVGFLPSERWEISITAERLHVPTRVRHFSDGFSVSRGGTARFITGEVSFVPVTFNRISPYVLVSAGRGISRPNVNEHFTDSVENHALVWFGGGGVRVALASHLSVFADMRVGFQTERDSIYGFLPVRAGVAWRF
jgi:hypothetical protein